MKKLAVVEGCTLQLSSGNGTIQITSVPSMKGKVQGKGIYCGQIDVSILAFTSSNIPNWISGSGSGNNSIIASAIKNKLENKPIVREEDSCLVTINGQVQSGNSVIPGTDVVTVRVVNSGQSVVRVE